jgi:hypothetical protein
MFSDPSISLRCALRDSSWNCKTDAFRFQDEFAPCGSQLVLELQALRFAFPE